MNINEIIYQLNIKSIDYLANEKLVNHSSVKIGGNVALFVIPRNKNELIQIIKIANQCRTKYLVLGKGTNTLFADVGFDGIVISTERLRDYKIFADGIFVESGMGLFEFGKLLAQQNFTGLEFCYGIPGSVGGAMITNAGAFEKSIGDFVSYVKVFANNKVFNISKKEMKFGYRTSLLENEKAIVLGVKFKLKKSSKEQIEKLQKFYFDQKKEKQPYDKFSLGSVFKRNNNFPPVSKLIDELGLKGYSIGGASISTKHAGFLINDGQATCKDFVLLIKYIQQKIFQAYGFVPELEIKFAGDI